MGTLKDNADQHHILATDVTEQEFINDPGLLKTSVCNSSITWLNGNKGELRYRGYAIAELANNYNFQEIMYLLLEGELPNQSQLAQLTAKLTENYQIPDSINKLLRIIPKSSHPMATIMNLLAHTTCYDNHEPMNILAIMPSLAIAALKKHQGLPFNFDPETAISTHKITEALTNKSLSKDHAFVRAMDKILILHADHELNASTFTMRVVASTHSKPKACLQAAIAALWGPAHGGANEACLDMLAEIGHIDNIPKFMARAKDKNDPFKLMGFGHRVYKNFDPRAKIMKEICHEVLALNDKDDDLLTVAKELEQIALNDHYCIERKLYPNVDFYSGITLSALGIPKTMFTAIFALARTIGWLSHWLEMHERAPFKIFRPRQFYDGITARNIPEKSS